jgi:hypothetical protein
MFIDSNMAMAKDLHACLVGIADQRIKQASAVAESGGEKGRVGGQGAVVLGMEKSSSNDSLESISGAVNGVEFWKSMTRSCKYLREIWG